MKAQTRILGILLTAAVLLCGCSAPVDAGGAPSAADSASAPSSTVQSTSALSTFSSVGLISGIPRANQLLPLPEDQIDAFAEAICYLNWEKLEDDALTRIGGDNLLNASGQAEDLRIWKMDGQIHATISRRENDSLHTEDYRVPAAAEESISRFLEELRATANITVTANYDLSAVMQSSYTTLHTDYSPVEGFQKTTILTADSRNEISNALDADAWVLSDILPEFGLSYLASIEGEDYAIALSEWDEAHCLVLLRSTSSEQLDCYLAPLAMAQQIMDCSE